MRCFLGLDLLPPGVTWPAVLEAYVHSPFLLFSALLLFPVYAANSLAYPRLSVGLICGGLLLATTSLVILRAILLAALQPDLLPFLPWRPLDAALLGSAIRLFGVWAALCGGVIGVAVGRFIVRARRRVRRDSHLGHAFVDQQGVLRS